MRVVGVGYGREGALEDGLGVHLAIRIAQGAVTLADDLLGRLGEVFGVVVGLVVLGLGGLLLGIELLGQGDGEQFVAQGGAPEGLLGGGIGGALGLAALPDVALVAREVEGGRVLEQGFGVVAALGQALAHQGHQVVAEGKVAGSEGIVEGRAQRFEALEVLLGEKGAVEVQRVDQVGPGDGGEMVAEAFAGEVGGVELADDSAGDFGVDRLGGQGRGEGG